MKKTYHISPSTTIIRNGKNYEILEFQPAGWPIWPSDNPAADARKMNEVLCAWLPVAAKELKSLLSRKSLWRTWRNRQFALEYIDNMAYAFEQVKTNNAIIQRGTENDQTNL